MAWKEACPQDTVAILAPHDSKAERTEISGHVLIRRFRYFWPTTFQNLVYPAILPNIRRKPWLVIQIPFLLFAELISARRFAVDIKADFVYAHWLVPQGLVAYVLSKILGTPYFLHNHSSELHFLDRWGSAGRWLARKIISHSEGLFCTNDDQRRHALGLMNHKLPENFEDKIMVVPMGVNCPGELHTSLSSQTNCQYLFGSISRLTRKKGLSYIIEACGFLDKEPGVVTLAIAGEGEEKSRLMSEAKAKDIEFTGFLGGDEKWGFFSSCKFMIFASKSSQGDVEGMPVSLLEALTLGKIVIASADTNIELLPEWPDIHDAVELIDNPSDIGQLTSCMTKLMALEKREIEARSNKLREKMARYLWPRLIQEYIRVFDEHECHISK